MVFISRLEQHDGLRYPYGKKRAARCAVHIHHGVLNGSRFQRVLKERASAYYNGLCVNGDGTGLGHDRLAIRGGDRSGNHLAVFEGDGINGRIAPRLTLCIDRRTVDDQLSGANGGAGEAASSDA